MRAWLRSWPGRLTILSWLVLLVAVPAIAHAAVYGALPTNMLNVAAALYGADGNAANTTSGSLNVAPYALNLNGGQDYLRAGAVANVATGTGYLNVIPVVQFNATANALTDGSFNHVQADSKGNVRINTEGMKATYSAATSSVTLAATPTDVFTIAGSATKTVRVTKIVLSGTQATAAQASAAVVIRSSADSSGTSFALTAVPHDSYSAAATATVLQYTANPTLGTLVGRIDARRLTFLAPATATTAQATTVIDYSTRNEQAPVLHGTAQQLAINFNGQTITGASMDFAVTWTEE